MAKNALPQIMAAFPTPSFIVGGLAVTFILIFLYKLYKQRRMMMGLVMSSLQQKWNVFALIPSSLDHHTIPYLVTCWWQ